MVELSSNVNVQGMIKYISYKNPRGLHQYKVLQPLLGFS